MSKKPAAAVPQSDRSPNLSYEETLDESIAESATIVPAHQTDKDRLKHPQTLKTSSFESDLSAPRRARNADQIGAYKNDPKYQKYVQLVERNLQSFDYVSEWADVTAFLTKLGRSFEIYSKFPVIPHKETVAKRLAQCLNPALPTGVHQKALIIYEQIFKQIGSEQLVTDLPLYSYGLFPFMRNASLKTKPQLLDIFAEFFIPLGSSLRSCMKSFTAGILPGFEEGSTDVLNRVVGLLDKLRDTVDPSFFYQTIFLVMITNVEQRESALKYLSQRIPVFTQKEDVVNFCGEDPSLMARALAATLTDSKTLVLRAALDLIMTRFPLRTNTFGEKDLVLLMKHAAEVVLKKDMSLNRRLYTWLLGPGESDAEQSAYFQEFAQKYLTNALLGSFAAMSSNPDHQHTVLRVLIGLLDKPVIAQPILNSIFVPLIQLLIAERDGRTEHALPVKLASVSRMFVEMLDPIFTWSSIVNQLTDSTADCSSGVLDIKKLTRALRLVLFFVQTFELDDDATLQVHIPIAMLTILATLDNVLSKHYKQQALLAQISCCFTRIAIEMFTRIPKSVFLEEDYNNNDSQNGGNLDSAKDPTSIIDTLQLDSLFDITRSFYRVHRSVNTNTDGLAVNPTMLQEDKEHFAQVAKVERAAAKIVRGTGLLFAIIRLSKNIAAYLGLHIVIPMAAVPGALPSNCSNSQKFASIALEDICHIMRTASWYASDLLDIPKLAECAPSLPRLALTGGNLEPAVFAVKEALHQDSWVPVFIAIVSRAEEFTALNVALNTLLVFVEHRLLERDVLIDDNNLTRFVERLWTSLSSDSLSDHCRATLLLCQLRCQIDARSVERYLACRLACGDNTKTQCDSYAREISRYSVFWRNLRLIQRGDVQWDQGGSLDNLAFSRLLLLVLDHAAPLELNLSTNDLLPSDPSSSALSRHMESRAWIDSSIEDWEYVVETLTTLLMLSVRTHKREYPITLATGFVSRRKEYVADFDYGRINYYIDAIQRYLVCAGDSVIRSMVSSIPKNATVLQTCSAFTPKDSGWLQTLLLITMEFVLTDAPSGGETSAITIKSIEQTRARAAELATYIVSRPLVTWPAAYIGDIQERVIESLLYSVLYSRSSMQPPLLDLFIQLVKAHVHDEDDLARTPDIERGHAKRQAGISEIPTLSIFSRLVLAAFTLQIDMVALSRWVKALTQCLPFIQGHVSVTPAGSNEEHDLMRSLVLPCLHTLRLLLSQCSEYFSRPNELDVAKNNLTRRQLYKRLIPLFAIPATDLQSSAKDESKKDTMSVDVLTVLLDAFDIFLSICLRNIDKIPATSIVQRPSSRASDSSVTTSNSLSTSGALASIPLLSFVADMFGQEDVGETRPAEDPSTSNNDNSAVSNSEETNSTAEFNLISTLAVLRDVWNAFELSHPRGNMTKNSQSCYSSPYTEAPLSDLSALLGDFGMSEARSSDSDSIHTKRAVHLHITRILEHAVNVQPADVTEAMAALWICDNPHWITDLQASPRVGVGQSRRRRSSASSVQSSLLSSTAAREQGASPIVGADAEGSAEWDWRAVDLLEKVPGRSPLGILTTLLNSLHIRTVNSETAASLSSAVSSNSALPTGSDTSVRAASIALLDDVALARFIELYSRYHLTARSSGALVPHIISMLKEYNNNAQNNKLVLPFLLRMFTELCERVANNSQAQDPAHRAYSNELCSMFARLVDNCILIAGRSFDQSTWLRRSNNAELAGASGLVIRSDMLLGQGGTQQCNEPTKVLTEDDIIDEILSYIGSAVIPQFSLLIPDYERQVTIASNLMHYAVTPAFKSHMTGGYSGPAQAMTSKSQHFALVLQCIGALSQQASLMKVWKREVWEFFCDSKFFPSSALPEHVTMSPTLAPYWRQLIRTLLTSEKEKFIEILGKISSSSSGPALFANREHEALIRAIAIRRLSFIIWAGNTNQYLSSLPQIQERLVDILKNSPHPAVQIEVFICLRVLLCRMANQHMSNFWPMLLTELIRLCLLQLNREGKEDPVQANLFLAACKFIDLLLVLGTDDFLVHQWIFITDTVDALYGSRSASSALLDQISSRLLSMPYLTSRAKSSKSRTLKNDSAKTFNSESYPKALLNDNDDPTNLVYQQVTAKGAETAESTGLDSTDMQNLSEHPLQRPILRTRHVSSIRDLDAFVHNASAQAYQAAYTMAEPDIEFIEALLLSDLMYFDFGALSESSSDDMSNSITSPGLITGFEL
ncbi:hypothetical protein GGI26_003929 [Coemansia sp. RSA 1358]|nr:hypothetical protein GGI26_003929 [Coemansia sp. RSA 1358]